MQYDVIESTDMNNVLIKELLSHEKTIQGLTQFWEKQDINHLKTEDIFLVVAGNGKLILKTAMGRFMLVVTITRKVTHLCAIA